MTRTIRLAVLAAAALAQTACIPPFSEMQSARTLGPGRTEITPFYSSVSVSSEGVTNKFYNQFGLMFGIGLGERADLRLRVERQVVDGEPDDALTVVGAGPKFSLVRDRIAVHLPLGLAFGQEIESSKTLSFHPALLFTLPVSKSFEINPSTKLLIPLNSDGAEMLWAANLGLAFGPDVRKWASRRRSEY